MPFALQLPLLTLGVAKGYEDGVRQAIRMGGCSSSRCTFFGACSAALGSPVPEAWTQRLLNRDVAALASDLASLLPSASRASL